jgi:DNA mismatch endonuclease (patch repair protein)
MADTHTPDARRRNMQRIRAANTSPEKVVRSVIHAMGFRFRLHRSDLPGRPDVILPRHKKIVFVNGCFWHLHKSCGRGRLPNSNRDYWAPKLRRNRERDAMNIRKLRAEGWKVKIIWECQVKERQQLRARLLRFLASPQGSGPWSSCCPRP